MLKRNLFALLSLVSLQILVCASCKQKAPEIEWQKSYGGSLNENPTDFIQTYDGGYIIAGTAESFDGDVIGNHGFCDYWILKIDRHGNTEWSKTYGGTYFDVGYTIQQTPDHGFMIGGHSYSFDGDVVNNHGACDWWILKIDSAGMLKEQQTIGGTQKDFGGYAQLTHDGGCIAYGSVEVTRDSITGRPKDQDVRIVKLMNNGTVEWQQTFSGSSRDHGSAIVQTADDGFALAINSESNDGNFNANHGSNFDIWLMKLDRNGKLQWKKNFGGAGSEDAHSISLTRDGGYIISGSSFSSDGDFKKNYGLGDFLILKLDRSGNLEWQKSYGGILNDWAASIRQTTDGGYIFVGETSSIGNDVKKNHGLIDCWVMKLNSSGNIQWQKSLGGSGNDHIGTIQQVNDGGYVIAGCSDSGDGDVTGNHGKKDYWIVKLKPE